MRGLALAILLAACRPPPVVNHDPYRDEPLRVRRGAALAIDLEILALHTGVQVPSRFGDPSCDHAPTPDLGHYCAGRIGQIEDVELVKFAHGVEKQTCARLEDDKLAAYCLATASPFQNPNDCTVLDRIQPVSARAPYTRACLVSHMAMPTPLP